MVTVHTTDNSKFIDNGKLPSTLQDQQKSGGKDNSIVEYHGNSLFAIVIKLS